MRPLTADTLVQIMPAAKAKAAMYAPLLDAAMAEFGITTLARRASFLAQVGHESGQLRYTREIWGPTAAQRGYEGRKDLGNTQPGDGVEYLGRGLIQITGRTNYTEAMMALDVDIVEHPELLESPVLACRSAAWFWKSRGLNQLADAGDQVKVTRRINGGINGLADRVALFNTALAVLA